MKENRVSVLNTSGEKLVGIETRPDNSHGKYPTVILVHGFAVTKEEYGIFVKLAEELSKANIVSHRFDFSGCGESEGDYAETSVTKLKEDLKTIIEFVKSQPIVDQSRIGIQAQSFGTSIAVALNPDVKAFLFTGSVSHPKESLTEHHKDEYNPNGISYFSKSDGRIVKINPEFWEDFDNYNLVQTMREVRSPILFIHGEKDQHVPISEMETFYENTNSEKKKIILEGATHGLEPHRDTMYTLAVEWFTEKLK